MINWELPHEIVACPHCGSTETQLTLQLLGVIRYSCGGCRKSFAIQGGSRTNPQAGDKIPATEPTATRS